MDKEARRRQWLQTRQYSPQQMQIARQALEEIRNGAEVFDVIRRHPLPEGGYIGKHTLVELYNQLIHSGEWAPDVDLLAHIRLKPMRTLSGVATVTVLTKPYPCSNDCLFCPDDEEMPKSYIIDEPGAKRAYEHHFDPYNQVAARIQALEAVGHPTNKVELLILGGTWTAYPKEYQDWFIRRCFDAMNENPTGANSINAAHQANETARHLNVGLVIETRPDHVNQAQLAWLRSLGVTKVQMGAQSMDDRILTINRRGHDVGQMLQATQLLRAAGFKIVLHWMPNLLGATPQSDREDFSRLWHEACPDEIKIYPTQLLKSAPLFKIWERGEYKPYSTQMLIEILADLKPTIPRYCRVNRVIRDIPSQYVVEGNKRTSLRQDVHREMTRRGTSCQCIRCREIKNEKLDPSSLRLDDMIYQAGSNEEHFISYDTPNDKLAGFLRLSLASATTPLTGLSDLEGAALIREVHVFGQSLEVGEEHAGAAQHIGLGSRLLLRAEEIALQRGFKRMAVIAAVGTRRYYQKRGFMRGLLYMTKEL